MAPIDREPSRPDRPEDLPASVPRAPSDGAAGDGRDGSADDSLAGSTDGVGRRGALADRLRQGDDSAHDLLNERVYADLFAAHPAPDLGVIRERGIAEAASTSRYTFYDGKVVPLGDAFELRERFNRVLEPLEWRERRALLEVALTWAAARVVGDTGARPRDGERALDPRVAQLVPEA